MISRNDPCWCGSGQKWKKCHYPEPPNLDFSEIARTYFKQYGIRIKTKEQIAKIRDACHVTAKILSLLTEKAKAGVSTLTLDQLSMELHAKYHAIPAPLHYGNPPYPKSICTSLNDVICHGIPDDRLLKEGDILNIDVSSIVDGYYGDCSSMVAIGEISKEKQTVIDVSKECLMRAIAVCRPNARICEIGRVIEDYAATYRCSVVNQFVGHGVGLSFHEPPEIPHHYNHNEIPMVPGMTFTIEPMINAGIREGFVDPVDHWTVRTKDGKPSAQWEHTIVITESGAEILTLLK